MKLIVGLGNPGSGYVNTRHNAGFLVVDALKEQIRNSKSETLNKSKILIFKSQNFMNESGIFVKKLIDKYNLDLSDLYVIHDDLDIPLGSFKIQFGVEPKIHNGIRSVRENIGTDQYWHVRVGIDNRKSEDRTPGEEYVLDEFPDEEREILNKVISEICKKLATL